MRRLVILAAVLGLLFVGCGEAEETGRQLFFPEDTVSGETVTVPAWFYPGDGTVEYLCGDCGNGVYGEDCPFYKFDGACSLVGDTLYYFHSGDLCAFDTEKGTWEVLVAGNDPRMLDRKLFKDEYLYTYASDSEREDGRGYAEVNRIYLPEMRFDDISGQGLPWKVADGAGYYVMADSSPYIVSGLYSQPLYKKGEMPPAKELLLHEVDIGIFPVLTEDAVYWIGNDRLSEDPEAVTHNLYRYDREKQSIIMLAEDFGSRRFVHLDGYLYAVCPHPEEDRDILVRLETGYDGKHILFDPADGLALQKNDIETAGQYVIVGIESETAAGKLVYDTETGEVQTYWLQEKTK